MSRHAGYSGVAENRVNGRTPRASRIRLELPQGSQVREVSRHGSSPVRAGEADMRTDRMSQHGQDEHHARKNVGTDCPALHGMSPVHVGSAGTRNTRFSEQDTGAGRITMSRLSPDAESSSRFQFGKRSSRWKVWNVSQSTYSENSRSSGENVRVLGLSREHAERAVPLGRCSPACCIAVSHMSRSAQREGRCQRMRRLSSESPRPREVQATASFRHSSCTAPGR